MSDDLNDPKNKNRIAQWEKIGVAAIRADLESGGIRYVGRQEHQALAWKWVESKETNTKNTINFGDNTTIGNLVNSKNITSSNISHNSTSENKEVKQPINTSKATLFGKIWHDSVWSKVIAALIIATASYAFALLIKQFWPPI